MLDHELTVAREIAHEAAALLRNEFFRPGGARGAGESADVDIEIERHIHARLRAAFPDDGYRGEELRSEWCPSRDGRGRVWLVDPNDGTASFLKGFRGSSVSIGLLENGEPVVGVIVAAECSTGGTDALAWAKGCGPLHRNGDPVPVQPCNQWQPDSVVLVSPEAERAAGAYARVVAPGRFRPMASLAYRVALVAAGEAAAAVTIGKPHPWDVVAAHALLRAGGGDLYNLHTGEPFRYSAEGELLNSGFAVACAAPLLNQFSAVDWKAVKSEQDTNRPGTEAPRFALARPVRGWAVSDSAVLQRAQGALMGQLVGDALGSQVEFEAAESIAADHPDGGPRHLIGSTLWKTLAGQPTDDSELALMLARTLLAERAYNRDAVARAYSHWLRSNPFDVGSATRRGFSAIAPDSTSPADHACALADPSTQANGALMRISPLGIFSAFRPVEATESDAREDARLSHPNPICRHASAVFAATIAHAIRTGESPKRVFNFAMARAEACRECLLTDLMESATIAPPREFQHQMGWVVIAFQNAFYELLHARSVEEGIVRTVRRGGDTDTNAAITGALLGAVHGIHGVPRAWRSAVLTCRPLHGARGVQTPRPVEFWPVDALVLAEQLVLAGMP
ncbi:MAG: inositol monophosphatase family protein [Candidatus Sumerlaeia bacterium]|nr:inositol monophosphatase family protein [Candidatus Sumerlaeia bacterium]